MVSAKLLLSHVYLTSFSLTEQKNSSNFLFTYLKFVIYKEKYYLCSNY